MTKETSFFSGTAGLVTGGVCAAIVIGVAVLLYSGGDAVVDDPAIVATPDVVADDTVSATPDVVADDTVDDAADATPDVVADGTAVVAPETLAAPDTTDDDQAAVADIAADPETPALPAPRFDVIYVNPDGTGTLAGRAQAGEVVAVLLNGLEIARTVADGQGAFVVLLFLAPSDQPRTVDLLADPDGTPRAAAETRIIGPTQAPEVIAQIAPDVVDPDTPASAPDVAQTAPAPVETADPAAEASAPATAGPITETPDTDTPDTVAPAILSADADGVRVVQPAALPDTPPDVMATVALDTITYDPAGDVLLGGRAQAGGFVRVYIDNQPVTTSPISESGDWRTDLPQVDTGVYTLRVDEVDAQGTVTSRIETPFQREEPATVAAAMAEETGADGFRVAVKTVQPGATLWAIAQERYGQGVMYVQVFEANRDRIRNPDLIYPGQVFVLPEDTQ
ncbi:LysM peptidoglycan-binding domain-containing protein [Octadecabacter sp. R77987]|uniref:LysM peptidoglycan-binding domain-containing protein n=1 Tax=Octadecabacter sp. R77987 TaxID=3093874 RepID=UPI003670494A